MKKLFCAIVMVLLLVSAPVAFGAEQSDESYETFTVTDINDSSNFTSFRSSGLLYFEPGEDFEYIQTSKGIVLTKYIGTDAYVDIPAYYNGTPIFINKTICTSAPSSTSPGTFVGPFVDNTNIIAVNLQTGVGVVDNNADYMFYGCTSLEIGPELSFEVGYMKATYYNCTSLQFCPTLPNKLLDLTECFRNCVSLIDMPTIPEYVQVMNGTFYNCTTMGNLTNIPDMVRSITDCFYLCENVEGTITMPDSIVAYRSMFTGTVQPITIWISHISIIDPYEFGDNIMVCFIGLNEDDWDYTDCGNYVVGNYYKGSSRVVNVPLFWKNKEFRLADSGLRSNRNVQFINFFRTAKSYTVNTNGLFAYCTSLINVTNIPSNIKSLDSGFSQCSSLIRAVELPEGIEDIDSLYYRCISLLYPGTLPDSVKSMDTAYYGTPIGSFPNMPKSLERMDQAFTNCDRLTGRVKFYRDITSTGLVFEGTTQPIEVEYLLKYTKLDSMYVPGNVTKVPIGDLQWEYTRDSVYNTVEVTKYIGTSPIVNVPMSIHGYSTFYNSQELFRKNNLITEVTFDPSVHFVNNTAEVLFYDCRNLVRVGKLPEGITSMSRTFLSCPKLKYAEALPDSVKDAYYVFGYCMDLEVAPDLNNATMGDHAFYSCVKLRSVPNPLRKIKNANLMFAYCDSLAGDITFSNDITVFTQVFNNAKNPITLKYPATNKVIQNAVVPIMVTKQPY